jgi:hypothetical protein
VAKAWRCRFAPSARVGTHPRHHPSSLLPTTTPQVRAIMVETTTFAHMRPFSPAALACLPTRGSDGAWVADGQDSAAASVGPPRRDLRDLLIFSVDPPGCQDIDDALSARYVLYGSCPGGPCCLTCPSWVGGRVWSRSLASAPCLPATCVDDVMPPAPLPPPPPPQRTRAHMLRQAASEWEPSGRRPHRRRHALCKAQRRAGH